MAADFNGTSSIIQTTAHGLTAYPVTFACWIQAENMTATRSPLSMGNTTTGSNGFSIEVSTSGTVTVRVLSGGLNSSATSTATVGTGGTSWNHVCGVFASDTLRTVYVDGANSVGNTASRAFPTTAMNRTCIGARFNAGVGLNFDGRVAEVAIWNAALNADEVRSLGVGYASPRFVRPSDLVSYTPLIRGVTANAQDLVSGVTFTGSGVVVADHVRRLG